jgi:hypothetical protein
MGMAKVTALLCPMCGSGLEAEPGSTLAQCRSCQASVAIGSQLGFYRFYAEPAIKRNAAISLTGQSTELSFELISAQIMFVPIWHVEGEAFGFVGGQRPIVEKILKIPISDTHGRMVYEKEIKQKTGGEVIKKSLWVKNEYRMLGVKWNELGGSNIRDIAPQMELMPEDDAELSKLGLVLEPDALAEPEIIIQSEKYFRGQMLYPYGNYKGLASHVSPLKQKRELIYYPVWRVLGFTKKGRYKCLLDGVSGERIFVKQYSKTKVSPPTKALAMVLVAALAMGMTLSPGSLTGNGWLSFAAPLLLMGILATGALLNRYILDRLAEKAARFIWRV